MKYFVTGATGFIGGRVARQLAASGHEVITLARNPGKASDLGAKGIKVVQGDITDKESMRAPMTGVDGVYHIAGWYKIGVRDKRPATEINVNGTRNVLELMKELQIPKGVYTSTLAVFSDTHGGVPDEKYKFGGQHISEYDRTKWVAHYEIAELMIEQGLPLIVVQPGLVYGPGDPGPSHDTWVQYLKRRLPVVPENTAYCWAHVDDIAAGHILAMDKGKPGESYIIAGPVCSMIDALALAEKITGVPAPRIHVGPGMMRAMAAMMDVVGAVVPLPELYSGETLRVTAGVTYLGSNEKAKRELGYKPRSLQDGLPETLAWEMQQLGMQPKN